jgi:hypothetical protein
MIGELPAAITGGRAPYMQRISRCPNEPERPRGDVHKTRFLNLVVVGNYPPALALALDRCLGLHLRPLHGNFTEIQFADSLQRSRTSNLIYLLTRLISFSFMCGRWEIVRGENLIADFAKIRSLSIPSRTRIFLSEFIMRRWEMWLLLMLINRAYQDQECGGESRLSGDVSEKSI